MKKDWVFDFGKYNGKNKSIENIWTGKIDGDESQLIRDHLRDFFDDDFFNKNKEARYMVSLSLIHI